MPHDDTIRDQAIAWAVRTGDPAFDDWDAFTEWLEQDPAHSEAYDFVSAAVDDASSHRPEVPANDVEPAETGVSRRWFGGALAACLALVAVVGVWRAGGGDQTYETAPGETRLVALDDGGTIELSGGSRLVLDDSDKRFARLESGQALFTIRHDEANPFRVDVAGDTLVDVGTIFDVRTGNGALTVSVSEGAVMFNPAAQNVLVEPGRMLTSAAGSDEYELASVPLDQVGEWREGRLTFQQASLAQVATDLGRATGLNFRAAPGSESRAISGSLIVAPIRSDPASLGPLLGVKVRKLNGDWVLEAR